jgi:hypothetical protein
MVDFQETTFVIGLVVLGIFVITLIVVVISKVITHFMKGPLEDRIAARYRPDEILMKDLKASSFGLESAGVWQLRGNGGLVLTGKQLHFFMFVPQSNLCVPLDAIGELTITKSHLGKATIYDLLKVHFSVDGKMDSIAWNLTDPKAWKNRIEALKSGGPTN